MILLSVICSFWDGLSRVMFNGCLIFSSVLDSCFSMDYLAYNVLKLSYVSLGIVLPMLCKLFLRQSYEFSNVSLILLGEEYHVN